MIVKKLDHAYYLFCFVTEYILLIHRCILLYRELHCKELRCLPVKLLSSLSPLDISPWNYIP